MAIDKSKLARDILESLGGRENIASVVHCATRLRFTLKDPKHADVAKCRGVYGVIAVVEKGGQHQVIIGNTVPEVYKEVVRIGALDTASGSGKQVKTGNIFSRGVNGLISTIAGIFPPILYPLIGCGLLMGILVVIKSIVGFKLGVDGNPILDADGKPIFILDESDTFKILHAISTTVFFFLPVLIGFSAGKRFGANPYITATIALALVHPDINSLAGGEINFFGIPNFGVLNFGSSVLPILFSSYLAAKIEIYLTAKLPSSIKNFIIPLTCFVIVVPLTIGIIGPITIWFANTLADGYKALPDWLPGILVGTFWQVLVVFGIHWAIVPMGWNNIATNGFDTLDPLTHVAALSQTGACFGIWLKMKNKEDRNLARQGWITGLFGITEPIIYGVTLKRKKQFLMGMIGGFCGGLIAGLIGAKSYRQGAYGFGALLSTLSNDGFEAQAFFGLLVGLLTSFSVAAVLSFITYKDDTMQNSTLGNMVESVSQSISNTASKIVTFLSPLKGVVKPMSQSLDPVFAGGAMGKGVLIEPKEGKLYSPCNGNVSLMLDTKHAVGILADNGAEVLIHVGIDTVKLDGKHFNTFVKKGDTIKTGQLLTDFDIDKIKAEGYSLETPMVVSNVNAFESIQVVAQDSVEVGDAILEIE